MKRLIPLILAAVSAATCQTITTIQSTDVPRDSRAVINTNFQQLLTYMWKNGTYSDVLQLSTPGTSPASGYLRVYAKTGSGICWKTSGGVETCANAGVGDVVGPASAVASNFVGFDTTTGKLLKDSGSKAADFAVTAKGVTNGDTHDHVGGDGAVIVSVNGVAYAASPALSTIPLITATNTATYTAVPNCADTGGNHLNYNSTTYAFSCGTSGGGSGATNVAALTDFLPTRTSATSLAVKGGTVVIGIKTLTIADAASCTLVTAGAESILAYLLNGSYVMASSVATVTCTGWTLVTGITRS